MSEIVACCGLSCSDCGAYKATLHNDDGLREKTAEEWRKMFNPDIKAEHINCLGCNSDVLFSHCNVCEIRTCCHEKKLDNCAGCDSFSCDKLEGILQHVPDARERLEKLRGK